MTQEDNYKQDFWSNLEKEWKEAAEKESHDWAKEFSESYDPFQKYEFKEENPLRDQANPLEEGKKKLAQGRLTIFDL